jgi:DNA helicase II / ATP-dependent DNA helicase PcrA
MLMPHRVGSAPPSANIDGKSEIVGADGLGFKAGERVFHEKFGYGIVRGVDANKLTVDFDKAGEKRVIDTFVTRA